MSDYLQERGDTRGVSRVALRRVEHLYYKTDAVYDAMRRMAMAQQESHAAGEAPVENGVETKTEEEGADLGEEDEPVDEAAVRVDGRAPPLVVSSPVTDLWLLHVLCFAWATRV